MTKKVVFRKSLVIGIIILFIGASVVPSLATNIKNITFSENIQEDFIEVKSQYKAKTNTKTIVRDIQKETVEKIMNLAEELTELLNQNPSREKLKEKFIEFFMELKNAELLPNNINVDNFVNTLIKRVNKNHKIPIKSTYQEHEFNYIEHYNIFNTVWGYSRNRTYSFSSIGVLVSFIAIKAALLHILGRIDINESTSSYANFTKLLDLCLKGPLVRFMTQRPKILSLLGGWLVIGNASLMLLGLQGIKRINKEGYGLYTMGLWGFLGLSLHFGPLGGLIIGFSPLSRIAYYPVENN